MRMAEIEAALESLTPAELRQVAVRSWAAFVEKEDLAPDAHTCDEDEPGLLAAIDEAIARVHSAPDQGHHADVVRLRLGWTARA